MPFKYWQIAIWRLISSESMNWREYITIDPEILVGKPVVKGTRLSVEFIIGLLSKGWSEAEILRNYPGITTTEIQACLAYAQDVLKTERVFPIAS